MAIIKFYKDGIVTINGEIYNNYEEYLKSVHLPNLSEKGKSI